MYFIGPRTPHFEMVQSAPECSGFLCVRNQAFWLDYISKVMYTISEDPSASVNRLNGFRASPESLCVHITKYSPVNEAVILNKIHPKISAVTAVHEHDIHN